MVYTCLQRTDSILCYSLCIVRMFNVRCFLLSFVESPCLIFVIIRLLLGRIISKIYCFIFHCHICAKRDLLIQVNPGCIVTTMKTQNVHRLLYYYENDMTCSTAHDVYRTAHQLLTVQQVLLSHVNILQNQVLRWWMTVPHLESMHKNTISEYVSHLYKLCI